MRISTLLFFFFVMAGAALASDPAKPDSSLNLVQRASGMSVSEYRLPRRFRAAAPSENGVCYKMRSYRVARTERSSDSTELVGYSTCQPSAKFEMKYADSAVVENEETGP